MAYYECHITIEGPATDEDSLRQKINDLGWKFSMIDGDPNLGAGTKFYATRQLNERMQRSEVLELLGGVAGQLCFAGYNVVREKIEMVIYDTRSSKVLLDD